MATAQTWMFSCGHEYTLIPSTPNHPPQPRLVQALVQAQSMTSPDSCPSCLDEVRRAEERRKDQLAEAVEALKVYKSHGTVLERQLVSFAGNPTLVEVYKSLERDCILYQAQKVNEIFLLRNFRREGYDSMNAVEKLRALEFEREGMKFMQIAAGAALERSEVRQFDGSWEGKLRYQMHQWRELNTELSTLLDGEPNVALVNTRATKKIEDIWSRALVLMGVEEQEKTIWEC